MSLKFISNTSKTRLTQKYIVFLFSLFLIFIPYLLIWLLIGEFNLLHLNWLIVDTNKTSYVFNINILYFFIGVIALSLLMFILLFFTKQLMKLDAIPFIVLAHTMCIITIVTALIPSNQSNKIFIIIARFIIVIVCSFVIFFITNSIINVFLLRSKYSHKIYNDFVDDNKVNKEIEDEIKSLKSSEKDYVDIEKG